LSAATRPRPPPPLGPATPPTLWTPVYWHRSAWDSSDGPESNELQINNKPYNAYALCVAGPSMQHATAAASAPKARAKAIATGAAVCLCRLPKTKHIWTSPRPQKHHLQYDIGMDDIGI